MILSKHHEQPLFEAANTHHVVGLILPYSDGFGPDPHIYHSEGEFLHLFNIGTESINATGVSRGVSYESGEFPPMNRVTMRLTPL